MRRDLPIDAHVPAIVAAVRAARAAVVTAAPGAGKTTRVPPALADDGPVILLQPRRVAARAIARRIADERDWTIGREVGWHVRFDRRSSPDTRLLVATEGILTARLQRDPLLADFQTVVIDEFHERSIHADLGLALARQAWLARGDLRLVVMSATIDPAPIAAFLQDCPIVEVPGRTFPIEVEYRPGATVEQGCTAALERPGGAVLCFLPGAGEIRRAADAIARTPALTGVAVWPLHGGLAADEQDAAIRPSEGRRIVLATNLAETTLTVPDVTCVIDSGLHKVARYDPERGIDSLETERISKDSADQRAGRAGRLQAGIAIRLWDARDRLRPHREPEIARVDLAGPALDVIAWGGDPRTLAWFEAPPADALDAALTLLTRLGALDASARMTPLGRSLQRLPLHPRLGRIVLAATGAPEAARACALLSERHFLLRGDGSRTTSCDLLAAIDREDALPAHVTRTARDIREAARRVLDRPLVDRIDDESFRRAVLTGYPDRVAQRRAPRSDRLLLASGTGGRLARESGVHDAAFLVAVDVVAPDAAARRRDAPAPDALVRMATAIAPDWLTATSRELRHAFDHDRGIVRAAVLERYDALILRESPCSPDPEEAARLIADEYVRRGPTDEDAQLLRRVEFAGLAVEFEALVRGAARGTTRIDDVHPGAHLDADQRRILTRDAPEMLSVPSGRHVWLNYRDGGVAAAVKLQELFGLAETPRLGPRRVPVTFELLAPSGRPVQVTSDLRSFWTRGYPEVRKELRARYPKHPWPEDPWTATPTRRAK